MKMTKIERVQLTFGCRELSYATPNDDHQEAFEEMFALDERPVFDSVPASVLDRPLKRQDIFDVEAITSKLRHKSPRNQRRAIEKAFKKRQAL